MPVAYARTLEASGGIECLPGGIERELHRVYLDDLQKILFSKLSRLLDGFREYSEVEYLYIQTMYSNQYS